MDTGSNYASSVALEIHFIIHKSYLRKTDFQLFLKEIRLFTPQKKKKPPWISIYLQVEASQIKLLKSSTMSLRE